VSNQPLSVIKKGHAKACPFFIIPFKPEFKMMLLYNKTRFNLRKALAKY